MLSRLLREMPSLCSQLEERAKYLLLLANQRSKRPKSKHFRDFTEIVNLWSGIHPAAESSKFAASTFGGANYPIGEKLRL